MDTDKKPFDLSDLDAVDEAHMTVLSGGEPTDWVWTFAGPGHPQAVAQVNRALRERLLREKAKEQAAANGKKWKAPDRTADEAMAEDADYVMERLLGWSPIKMGGEDYPFSQENARKLLMDPRKGALRRQAVEFLLEDNSFTKRSPKT